MTTNGKMLPRWETAALAVLLAAAVLCVYWPASGYDFVRFDDDEWIYANPLLRKGLSLDSLREVFSQFRLTYWIPVTWLSLLLDAQLFGLDPRGFHTVNILWHTANSLLVFGLLRRGTGCRWRSLLVAAVFALHPLRVESVVWATERKDVLSAFFYLLALATYGAYVVRGKLRWYLGALLFFTLGMMAKPSFPTFPAALLVLDFWPLRRLSLAAGSWKRLLGEKVPFAAVSLMFSVVTLAAQSAGGSLDAIRQPHIASVLERYFSSHLIYLGKFLVPLDLAVTVYVPPPAPRWGMAVLAGILFAAVTAWTLGQARRRPPICAGWLWYVVTLLPASGLLQFGGQWLGDRFTYLPQLGLAVAVVWWVGELARGARGRRWCALAGGMVVCALVGLTLAQERHWRDTRTLFTHAVEVSDDNLLGHLMLGILDGEEGRAESAISHYRRVLDLSPGHSTARTQLAIELVNQGRLAEATEEFQAVVRQTPNDPDAHFNLAVSLERQGHALSAAVHYRKVLALRPDDAGALHNLLLLREESTGEGGPPKGLATPTP